MKINYGTHEFEKSDPTDMSYGAGLRINSLEIYDPLSAKKSPNITDMNLRDTYPERLFPVTFLISR